jgi:hypothetical protein
MRLFPLFFLLAHHDGDFVAGYDSLHPRSLNYTGPYADGGSWTSGFAQAKALVDQMVRREPLFLFSETYDLSQTIEEKVIPA